MLISYSAGHRAFVRRHAEAQMPSAFGTFQAIGYLQRLDGKPSTCAIVKEPRQPPARCWCGCTPLPSTGGMPSLAPLRLPVAHSKRPCA